MTKQGFGDNQAGYAAFGRRKVVPRACVVDSKKHLRAFLSEIIEDLGLVATECANADELAAAFEHQLPDLVVFGVSTDGIDAGDVLQRLVRRKFSGNLLTIGTRESILVRAVQQVGEEYGLAMLPPLTTPFSAETWGADFRAAPQRTGSQPGGAGERGIARRLAGALVPGKG